MNLLCFLNFFTSFVFGSVQFDTLWWFVNVFFSTLFLQAHNGNIPCMHCYKWKANNSLPKIKKSLKYTFFKKIIIKKELRTIIWCLLFKHGVFTDGCCFSCPSHFFSHQSFIILKNKKKKNNLPIKNGLPTKCPPYSLLDSSRQQLESTKVIGSLLVIIHRSLGHDPRQEPHTCNIHLCCSLRKRCHENH